MQSPEVKAFKYELRNYGYYCYRIRTLSESMEYCYERLGGVRGIDPSKEPTHVQPNKELEYKLRDDIESYRAEIERLQKEIDYMDGILSCIETSLREAIKEVFVEGKQMRAVADRLFLSHSGLQGRINRSIKEAICNSGINRNQ